MFREMRRPKQLLAEEDCVEVLVRNTAGVLALYGDEGYPYAVPLSYVYADDKIYFHCAKSGHIMDSMKRNVKVSFCVIDEDQIIPEEFTTYFRSVIVFGKARILEGEEKMAALRKLCRKYSSSQSEEHFQKVVSRSYNNLEMVEISIDYKTGKEAVEFVNRRKLCNR